MRDQFLKIFLAFFVGLIPFLLKIYFDRKSYHKSQKDKYASFLFEQQYEIYIELFNKFRNLYESITDTILLEMNGKEEEEEEEEEWFKTQGLDQRREYTNQLDSLEKYIENNTILIPNKLIKLLNNYIDYSHALYDTEKVDYFKDNQYVDPYIRSFVIKDKNDLKDFADKSLNEYLNIMLYLKTLIGTEVLSKKTIQYLKKNKKNEINGVVMRITKVNVK